MIYDELVKIVDEIKNEEQTRDTDVYAGAILRAVMPTELRQEITDALTGESNDAEHDALVSVADHFVIDYEVDDEDDYDDMDGNDDDYMEEN